MSSAEDFEEGKRLYSINCGVCHGIEGKTERGARLARRSYRHGNSNAELFDLIEAGIPNTEMPGLWLDEDDIWRILLFVRRFAEDVVDSCGPGTGDAAVGKLIFNRQGSCLACHTVGLQGGRLGPDMSFAGELFSRQQLSDALLEPHANIAQRYSTVRVVTPDGETVEGVAMNENKYHVYLMDRAENIRSFRKSTLKSLEHPEQSLMPSYRDLLNTTQLNDLLAYLCTLRKPATKKTK